MRRITIYINTQNMQLCLNSVFNKLYSIKTMSQMNICTGWIYLQIVSILDKPSSLDSLLCDFNISYIKFNFYFTDLHIKMKMLFWMLIAAVALEQGYSNGFKSIFLIVFFIDSFDISISLYYDSVCFNTC